MISKPRAAERLRRVKPGQRVDDHCADAVRSAIIADIDRGETGKRLVGRRHRLEENVEARVAKQPDLAAANAGKSELELRSGRASLIIGSPGRSGRPQVGAGTAGISAPDRGQGQQRSPLKAHVDLLTASTRRPVRSLARS